jgi:hypothetical protein
MTEAIPYFQIFAIIISTAITVGTVVFYGGRLTQRQENDSKRITNIESVLFDENGIQEKVTRHNYHIEHFCGKH